MTIAEYCILGAVLLYLLTIAPFKPLGGRAFDNSKPRDPEFYKDPLRSRALGAHLNGIETFPFFAVAVLFLIVRLAYVLTYLGDRPTLRTILWNVGFAINLAIFFMPVIKGWLPA